MQSAKVFTVVVNQNEDGYYFAEIPEVPGVFTWGDTFKDLIYGIKEALELHFEDEAGINMDKVELNYRLPVNAVLELLGIENKAIASFSGINNTLLSQYRSGTKKAGSKQKLKIQDTIQQLGEVLSHLEVM